VGNDDLENNYSSCQQEDIIDAAVMSNAHDFISSFPNGYDTDVGEGSVSLSGGQKQRIAIARALIKKPSILLLDEATSALDAVSERMVQESIDNISKTKSQTTVIIAHRLSTIVNADKIVVIENNRISDVGKHDELLVRNNLYSQLWSHQAQAADEPEAANESQ
jgi:ABC-type multidrug transport system fused ATPase/permease subunit